MNPSLPTEAALVVANPDSEQWDRECELLVVGVGAAGATTTLVAHDQGVDVLAVDRFGHGGASASSGGIVYAGATRQQRESGIEDTPEQMFEYLKGETGDAVSHETLGRFCEESAATLEWLESLGIEYRGDANPPKTSYPKNGVYLYYSGNETIRPFCDTAKPAPRGHRTVDKGLSGRRLYRGLDEAISGKNIPFLKQAAVRRLITDEAGAVIGAEVWQVPVDATTGRLQRLLTRLIEPFNYMSAGLADASRQLAVKLELKHATAIRVRATKGVALTTGGFGYNKDMLLEHAPSYVKNLRLGPGSCDGSGIRLGQSVGAATDRMEKISAWRFYNPPTKLPRGIVVNQQGQRFYNEGAYGARLGVLIAEEQNDTAWLIIDRKLRKAAIREALFGGLWLFQWLPTLFVMLFAKRAQTPARLARKLGIPAEPFCATLHRYNLAASGQSEDELGKDTAAMDALDNAPYYAINISSHNPSFPAPVITLGGLKIDESTGAVLKADGQPVPGLYAAGRAAVGIASNYYVSGLSLADCFFSGRRIGRTLAQQKPAQQQNADS